MEGRAKSLATRDNLLLGLPWQRLTLLHWSHRATVDVVPGAKPPAIGRISHGRLGPMETQYYGHGTDMLHFQICQIALMIIIFVLVRKIRRYNKLRVTWVQPK